MASKELVPQGKRTPVPETDMCVFDLIPVTLERVLCSLKSRDKIRQGWLKLHKPHDYQNILLALGRHWGLGRYFVCLFFSSVENTVKFGLYDLGYFAT